MNKVATFVIGSTDDFQSMQELMEYVEEHGWQGSRNYQLWEYDYPADCSEELVVAMGRGYAFSNSWCMDGTFSFLIDGALEIDPEDEMVNAGTDAREAQKASRSSGTPCTDDRQLNNDPINW